MRYSFWTLVGIACISIPFLMLYDAYDPWNALIAGTIGGSLFLALLLYAHRASLRTLMERTIIITTAVLLIGASLAQTFLQRSIAVGQRENMREIRNHIGAGIIVSDKIHESMLPVLHDYHRQAEKERRSIVECFHLRYDFALSNGSFNKTPYTPDVGETMDPVTIVRFSGDSLVQYHCVDTIALGKDPHFHNVTGHTGKLEIMASLTAQGVTYERLN